MITKIRDILLAATIILFLTGCGSLWQSQKKAEVMAARSGVMLAPVEPRNIVLMLPLKGELAATSQAIRNGFLAAYYYSRKQHPAVNIKVIDTTGNDIQVLYKQIVADGAEIVVGPLTKNEVGAIMMIKPLPVPTIALNTLDDYPHNFAPNLYQFGLLPQDEAFQVATKMMQAKHNRVAVITPAGAWGNKIATVFREKYLAAGGQVIATLNYRPALNLAEQICPFLALDATKLCVSQKHKDKKEQVTNEIMRRQDINAIFLIANAAEARQIVPLLKFYYAGDLPLYSTSAVYAGVSAPNLDQDIEDVYFCDMPWVLKDPGMLNSDHQAIYKQIAFLWPDSFISHKRLYALGVDAYNLSLGLNGFLNSPQKGMVGASGVLYLDDFNHIYRHLEWGQMRGGVVVQTP